MLERELGRGGMATVYAAHDVRHDRRVALKVLHPELAASLGPERFQSYRAHTVRPTYVSWSTDSRTIYCLVLDSLDRASVVGIDPGSGERKLLVRFDDDARDWQRYGFGAFGGRLYFTLGDRQSDLWTAAVDAGR